MDFTKIDIGKAEDLTDQKFGCWTVLYRTTNNKSGKVRWVCQCSCENQTIKAVDAKSLKSGTSTNCGCQRLKTLSIQADQKIHRRDEKGNIIEKKCFRCNQWLPLTEFWKNSSQKDGYAGECKTCSYTAKENRYNIYKKNAKKRNLAFNITKEEFYALTKLPCKYCGDLQDYNGIDRVDSTLGYYIDNCVPCCQMCNAMKLNYSTEEWFQHMKKILLYQGE